MKPKEIKQMVDRMAELTRQQAEAKEELERLKAQLEIIAQEDLKDKKQKTAEYWGDSSARVVVTNSATVKPVSMTMVKQLLGGVYQDFVREEVSYKMSEPCKRLMAMMCLGEYTEETLDNVIRAITEDEKIQKALKKKLKGKFEKDTETLIHVAGLTKQEAGDWAYLAAEVINWEWMVQILKAADWGGSPAEAVDMIRTAVIVDEGIKVTVMMEQQ